MFPVPTVPDRAGQGLKVGRIPGGVLIVVASCADAPGVAEKRTWGKPR